MKIKKVLYITTQMTGTLRHFTWTCYPDIAYSRIQRKILKLLGEYSHLEVNIRLHPSDRWKNPQVDWVQENFPHMKILDQNVPTILQTQDFDLIITEGFATTLLEALCTKSKILLFAPKDFIKIHADAKALLQQRINLAETTPEYYKLLQEIVLPENLEKPVTSINDDFLFKYGINSTEDNPLMFAKEAIESILQSKKNVRKVSGVTR